MEEKKTRTKEEMDRIREQAEDCFLRLGMKGREIAKYLDVSEQSISGWRKNGNWDKRKELAELTPVKLKELMMEEARKVIAGEKSEIDADQLSKIMASIDRLDKRVNARVVMEVLRMLDNFTADINPKHAIESTKYHKLFLQHIISLETN